MYSQDKDFPNFEICKDSWQHLESVEQILGLAFPYFCSHPYECTQVSHCRQAKRSLFQRILTEVEMSEEFEPRYALEAWAICKRHSRRIRKLDIGFINISVLRMSVSKIWCLNISYTASGFKIIFLSRPSPDICRFFSWLDLKYLSCFTPLFWYPWQFWKTIVWRSR